MASSWLKGNRRNYGSKGKSPRAYNIRQFVKKQLYTSGISRVYIDRLANERVHINIFTAKPGMIVGRGGENIKILKGQLEKLAGGKDVKIDISEVANIDSDSQLVAENIAFIDSDSQLVAENIAFSLERRISFRRAMKQVMQRAIRAGAKGIKVMVSGRLNGAEIARSEGYSEGNVPLSTLRANIDYGFAEADTAYGKIGIKVWIYKGEVLPQADAKTHLIRKEARAAKPRNNRRSGRGGRSQNNRRQNRNSK
ncbi:MAG: 30S ribosomal protein S3, partial [Clostridiales bacterium]